MKTNKSYVVESDFVYKNFRCVCLGMDMGHRCGYVGLPEGHSLYGKDYRDACLPKKDVEDQPIGKRGIIPLLCSKFSQDLISPDVYFDVHGSLTYSGGGKDSKYPVESDLWWLGFDCCHSGDGQDEQLILSLCETDLAASRLSWSRRSSDPARTQDYVESELKSLVDQIITVSKGGNV